MQFHEDFMEAEIDRGEVWSVRVDTWLVQLGRMQGTRQLLACAVCRHRILQERTLCFDLAFADAPITNNQQPTTNNQQPTTNHTRRKASRRTFSSHSRTHGRRRQRNKTITENKSQQRNRDLLTPDNKSKTTGIFGPAADQESTTHLTLRSKAAKKFHRTHRLHTTPHEYQN